MVETLVPKSFSIFVHSFAEETFLKFAIISLFFFKSVLLKIIPELEFAGIKVTSTFIPECNPTTEKLASFFNVF